MLLIFVLAVLLSVSVLQTRADTGRLFTPDRLSSGLITCICQDRYGFVWVGTEYGLNKFDGYRYTTYFHSRRDSATLTDNEVSSLFVDSRGRLWVGCSRGLVSYDYEHDHFRRYAFPEGLKPRVNSMAEAPDGRMLIGTAGYGLYSVRADGHIDYESRLNSRHEDHFYSRMHIDRQGYLWRSSHLPTLTRYALKAGQHGASRDFQSVCGMPMRFIEYGADRLLIVCTNGIMTYDYRTGLMRRADADLSALDSNGSIEDAMLDRQGNLYIATSGSGLLRLPAESRRLERVANTDSRIDLSTANVVDVMEDRAGNLWVACYNKGLLLLSRRRQPFHTWSLSDQHYVTGGGVAAMAAADAGGTWCTVQNSGVYRLDSTGRVTAHPSSPTGTRLIFRSRDGHYWLTTENVLYRYDPLSGRATPELTLNGRGLNCMAEGPDGRLFICSFGMGLYVWQPATRQGKLLSMRQTGRAEGRLCNDWIKALTVDSRGLLWICTTSGVSLLDPRTGTFNSRGWSVLLDGQQCYAACETAGGDMLIGTESGLYCYRWRDNTISEAPHAEALHDKMICAMVRDGHGDIWISTSMGIWQYSPTAQRLNAHLGGKGLTTKAYVLGAALQGPDDRISFGTADGMVTFHPAMVANDATTKDNKTIQPDGSGGAPLLTRITAGGRTLNPLASHHALTYADNSVSLEFSLLDFINAENTTFQYRINGADHWTLMDEGANLLAFNRLQPGDYRIDIRAAADSLGSLPLTTVTISVGQPWYKTTWAYLLYALLAATIGALALFGWNRYQAARQLHTTVMDMRHNMRWLRNKFFGSLEEKGDISQVKVKGNNDALMERVVKCVNENLSNPDFSVEMLTREVGISRAQLHRKMKEMTGLSTSEFIRDLRLKQAAHLISEHKINITQVAYSVGFNNQAHFSTVFKKHYGITPTEYAEKNP